MSVVDRLVSGDNVIKAVGNRLEAVPDTDEDRAEKETERVKSARDQQLEMGLIAAQNQAQVAINLEEAKSGNWFVAGWRPAIGWIGALALFYQFVLYPLLLWLPVKNPPQPLDYTTLYTLITGVLGIAGLRSFDKTRSTDTKRLQS